MNRLRLANRRAAETIAFQHAFGEANIHYVGSIGRFNSGDVAEIFLNARKHDTASDVNARDGAVAISLALQYGCPVDILKHAMARKPNGTAMGPLGHLLDLAVGDKT